MRPQVAVVTGAASGIGRAIAERLARLGYAMVLVDAASDGLDKALCEISSHDAANEGLHRAAVMDVSDALAWRSFAEESLSETDDVALLVQAAGVLLAGRLSDCPLEEIQRLTRINLDGVLLGASTLGPRLACGRSQATQAPPLPRGVLNIASIFASAVPPGFAAYNASKAGVVAATETLRGEWSPLGLTATAVLPGVTPTGLFNAATYADERLRELVSRRVGEAELSVDRVADASLDAYRRRRVVAAIGGRAGRYHWLKRFFPSFLLRRVAMEANRELPS